MSPANVILSMDGQVKLVDFGIAKAVDVGGTTRAGTVKGKYAYMSPEQLRGDDLDKRSDIFSLGVVLYEMITRQRLFRGQNEAAIAKALLHDTIPGLVARAPGQVPALPEDVVDSMQAAECPPALEQIIMKCLARDREGRYQSAGALQDALDDFSRSERYEVTTGKIVDYMRYVFPARVEPELSLTPPPPRTSGGPPSGGLLRSSAPPVSGVTPQGASSGAASQRPGGVLSTPPLALQPSELAPPVAEAPPEEPWRRDRSTPYMVIGLLLLSAAFWFFVYPNL